MTVHCPSIPAHNSLKSKLNRVLSCSLCFSLKGAIAFIRGERPVLDYKYDILKHPNVGLSKDGGAPAYVHGFGELEGNPWAHGVSKEVYDITKEVETMARVGTKAIMPPPSIDHKLSPLALVMQRSKIITQR